LPGSVCELVRPLPGIFVSWERQRFLGASAVTQSFISSDARDQTFEKVASAMPNLTVPCRLAFGRGAAKDEVRQLLSFDDYKSHEYCRTATRKILYGISNPCRSPGWMVHPANLGFATFWGEDVNERSMWAEFGP
jgi:hypothetical protein